VCGYAAYYVANVGVRDHHKSVDVIFSTLVFGFFSYFAYAIFTVVFDVSITWASALTFAVAIVYGSLWSRLGRPFLEMAFRRSKVAYSDDLPSACPRANDERDPTKTPRAFRLRYRGASEG
jgi:hypothetical protein